MDSDHTGAMSRSGARTAHAGGAALTGKQDISIKAAIEVPTEGSGTGGIKGDWQVLPLLIGTFTGIKNGHALRWTIHELQCDIDAVLVQPVAWVNGGLEEGDSSTCNAPVVILSRRVP